MSLPSRLWRLSKWESLTLGRMTLSFLSLWARVYFGLVEVARRGSLRGEEWRLRSVNSEAAGVGEGEGEGVGLSDIDQLIKL